jgi:phenylalanyl-tRNA synthetase alpha chain
MEQPPEQLIAELEALGRAAEDEAASLQDAAALAEARERFLGRESRLGAISRGLKGLASEDRPRVGAALGAARRRIEGALAEAEERVRVGAEAIRLAREADDLEEWCHPGRLAGEGAIHLVSAARMALEDVFVAMGFVVAEGPEVETDWYNFEALNMPAHHPARASQDSFYIDATRLLRTHTSPVQIRIMEARRPPIAAIVPGRVYRRDTPDARHTVAFHQLEALVVDRGITFAHLKATIEAFTSAYFGSGIAARLRPGYFPFTEPSAEFEITCTVCRGEGCRTCSQTGWVELGGSGMVHPRVLERVGIDPEVYSGFAFGFGIDRLAQMRVELEDVRILAENDERVLAQLRRVR